MDQIILKTVRRSALLSGYFITMFGTQKTITQIVWE